MERAESIIAARRLRFAWYRRELEGTPGIGFQPVAEWATPAPWLFCITVDQSAFGCTRNELAAVLDRAGIETRPFFVPIHDLPPYAEFRPQAALRVTEQLARTGLNLPTSSTMGEEAVRRVADVIRGLAHGTR